jgi:hypothetical protein
LPTDGQSAAMLRRVVFCRALSCADGAWDGITESRTLRLNLRGRTSYHREAQINWRHGTSNCQDRGLLAHDLEP